MSGPSRTSPVPSLPVLLLLLGLLAMHGVGMHGLPSHEASMTPLAAAAAAMNAPGGHSAATGDGGTAAASDVMEHAARSVLAARMPGESGHGMGLMGLCVAVLLAAVTLALLASAARRGPLVHAGWRHRLHVLRAGPPPRHRTLDLVAGLCVSRT